MNKNIDPYTIALAIMYAFHKKGFSKIHKTHLCAGVYIAINKLVGNKQ